MSEKPPEDIDNFEMGQSFLERRQFDRALECFKKAVALNPTKKEFQIALAETYKNSGQYQQAIQAYQRSAELEKNGMAKSQILAMVGDMLLKTGDYDNAIKSLQQASKLDESNIDILYNIADAQSSKGEKDKAIATLEQALKIDPEHLNCLDKISTILTDDRKDYQNAIKYLTKVLERDPMRSSAQMRLGRCYFMVGRKTDGVKLWLAVIAEDPKNTAAYFGLGSFYAENKQFDEAMKMYTPLQQLSPTLAKELMDSIAYYKTKK